MLLKFFANDSTRCTTSATEQGITQLKLPTAGDNDKHSSATV